MSLHLVLILWTYILGFFLLQVACSGSSSFKSPGNPSQEVKQAATAGGDDAGVTKPTQEPGTGDGIPSQEKPELIDAWTMNIAGGDDQGVFHDDTAKKIWITADLACPSASDFDPQKFKGVYTPVPPGSTFYGAGKDVDFFESADFDDPSTSLEKKMSEGPALVLGLWTTDAPAGFGGEHIPTSQNFISLGYSIKDLEIKGQLTTDATKTPTHLGHPIYEMVAIGAKEEKVSIEQLLRRGLNHMAKAKESGYSSKNTYIYAGVMACNDLIDAQYTKNIPRDKIYAFFSQDVKGKILSAEGIEKISSLNAEFTRKDDSITLNLTDVPSAKADQHFSEHVLVALAQEINSHNGDLSALKGVPLNGSSLNAGALLIEIKTLLASSSPCKDLGTLLGSDQQWWEKHAEWDAAGLNLSCSILNGGTGQDSFSTLTDNLSVQFAEVANRLLRAAAFVSASSQFPSEWLGQTRCFKTQDSFYVNTVLNSHIIPLKIDAAKNIIVPPEFFTTAAALPPELASAGGVGTNSEANLKHPEPSFAISIYTYYLPKKQISPYVSEDDYISGNIQTTFGMVTYPGTIATPLNSVSDTTSVSAPLSPIGNYSIGPATFLNRDLLLKFYLRRYNFCGSQSRIYCLNGGRGRPFPFGYNLGGVKL